MAIFWYEEKIEVAFRKETKSFYKQFFLLRAFSLKIDKNFFYLKISI